jgi:hypothetical protein
MPITADWRDNNPDQNKIIRFPDGSINFIAGPIFPRGQEAEALAHAVKLRENFERANSELPRRRHGFALTRWRAEIGDLSRES